MLSQQELAQKIRNGYAKHRLTVTHEFFYDEQTARACPIFAAFSSDFDDLHDAYKAHQKFFELKGLSPYTTGMAKALNADYTLVKAVSNMFDYGNINDLDEVLAQLDSNSFEYSAD